MPETMWSPLLRPKTGLPPSTSTSKHPHFESRQAGLMQLQQPAADKQSGSRIEPISARGGPVQPDCWQGAITTPQGPVLLAFGFNCGTKLMVAKPNTRAVYAVCPILEYLRVTGLEVVQAVQPFCMQPSVFLPQIAQT